MVPDLKKELACHGGARWDVFEYIMMFYNLKHNGMLSPLDLEERQCKLTEAGV